MINVIITYADGEQPLREALEDGEGLLLGRSPDVDALAPEGLPGVRLRAVALRSPTVSGNHALVWREGLALRVRDLRSRNGTWARLSADGTLSVAGAAPVELELAPASTAPPLTRPRDASWASAEEFPSAVAQEVNRWLAAGAHPLTVGLERRDAPARGRLPPIPLTSEWQLRPTADTSGATIDPLWGPVIEALVSYVHEQRAQLVDDPDAAHGPGFVLASPVFRRAHQRVLEASVRGLPLIVLGPTGAGKGTLARCYHDHSAWRGRPFEQVNCAEIDKHFARTRLFGARKGAYTGCVADIAGSVESAHGGTLFLDEIAELPMDVQGELLTFLDDHRYKRLGDDQWRKAETHLVCGTNADLREAVRLGRFRADLWYRIAGRIVEIPPLRDRPEDVAAYLQGRPVDERLDAPSCLDALTPAARRLLLHGHDWAGNFRELASFVRRMPAGLGRESLDVPACRELLHEGAIAPQRRAPAAPPGSPWSALLEQATELYQRRVHAEGPQRAGELKEYIEDVLKPMFFARSLGLEHLREVPERPSPTWEELARRLGCDGATVKNQIARFVSLMTALEAPTR